MIIRSPLNQARGHGSGKEGTQHWWIQRLTAIALIPLCLWFIYSLISMTGMDYNSVIEWLDSPIVCTLLVLLIISIFYHTQLGIQVVIEDYIESEAMKIGSIVVLNFIMLFAGLVSTIAVLKVFFGL